MESTISNAFLLLGIGMITVFTVLSIVVLTGSVLISLINKYSPNPLPESKLIKPLISNKEVAVISAVVDHLTSGKGTVDSIEKVN